VTDTSQAIIGVDAICADGYCGEVSRVVADPISRSVTHLVVGPKRRRGLGKLVPLDLVDARTDEVRLRCTLAEFDKLDAAEETPGNDGGSWSYAPKQSALLP
jgi:hypothetical protein